MKQNKKYIVLLMWLCFSLICAACWFAKPQEYSVTERRTLAQFPKLSVETLTDGSFMTDFEEYTLDQFPFREKLRAIKAWIQTNILKMSDNHKIYTADGYAVKMEYPLNEDSLESALKKFEKIYQKYLGESEKIYLSVIPDKNYFLAEKSGHLSMDYDAMFEKMQKGMPYAESIDLTESLTIEDYYKTDVHWRQERLADTAAQLADAMQVNIGNDYEEKTLDREFYGVYFGQSALNLPGEKLYYLTNEVLEQCQVYNYENQQTTGIYDLEKAEGEDPYEIFLSGPVSLMTIENPLADTERELIVFRDSFGSSLIPLLAEGYAKVTLIDIRYIQSDFLVNFVDFTGKDVLFLYSTVVLNNSETFK